MVIEKCRYRHAERWNEEVENGKNGKSGRCKWARVRNSPLTSSLPNPEPGTILLKQEMAGICGTDLHNWQNGFGEEVLLGHENVGIVEAIRPGVETDHLGNTIEIGDRVVFASGVPGDSTYGFRTKPDTPPYFSGGR